MITLYEFLETEEKKHDAAWFNKCCQWIRMYMSPLISKYDAQVGMSYMEGKQDMGYIQDQYINPVKLNLTDNNYQRFRGKSTILDTAGQPISAGKNFDAQDYINSEMSNVDFVPLPVMETIKNIITHEIMKMGAYATVRAVDAMSELDRERDKQLIKNREKIERDLSYLYTSIGDKPYKMAQHENRFGEKPGNGNLEVLDQMGMDAGDPTDVEFLFTHFYKLYSEINVQKVLDAANTANHLESKSDMWALDMMAKKCIAARTYVNKLTGKLEAEYITPETTFIYGATTRHKDFNDATAKCTEQSMTLQQALALCGDSFDVKEQFGRIITAYQTQNTVEFTGVDTSWNTFVNNGYKLNMKHGGAVGWNDILSMKISFGYMEISSQVQIGKDETKMEKGEWFEDNQPANKEKYQAKARYETPVYCAYYLALTQTDQIIFDFGKVPYQDIEGYNDQFNNFTIVTFKETGDPIGIQCIPYVNLINEAWYKAKYILRKAKPPGTDYNLDSLLEIAGSITPEDNNMTLGQRAVMVMHMLDSSGNGLWTFPRTDDGRVDMRNIQQLNIPRPNGINRDAMTWFEIVAKTEQMMMTKLGMSDLRLADAGTSKDSVSNQFKALEYSIASTAYINEMISRLYKAVSIRELLYIQDIVTYKSYSTMAYKYLERLVDKKTLSAIEALGKNALHRFGIVVEMLNPAPLKAKMDAILSNDMNANKITTGEALLINSIKNPKEAWATLAYLEQRNRKLAQKDAMAAQKAQADQQQKLMMMQLQMKKMELDNTRLIAAMNNQGNIQGKGITQEGGLKKQLMKENATSLHIYEKADADLRMSVQSAQDSIDQMANPQPQMPPQGGPEQQQQIPIEGDQGMGGVQLPGQARA